MSTRARPRTATGPSAYVSGGALWLYYDRATGTSTALAEPESDTVRYGLADFIAAEEMERMRGYWWSPSGDAVLVARTDDAPVHRWHIADPANPDRPPTELSYPAAGTPNAITELFVYHRCGTRVAVDWTGEYYRQGALGLPRPADLRPADGTSGRSPWLRSTRTPAPAAPLVRNTTDPAWVDIVPGVPAHLSGGALVWTSDVVSGAELSSADARRLVVDGEPVTPPSLRVRRVLDIDDDTVLFTASDDPTQVRLWTYRPGDGPQATDPGGRCVRRSPPRRYHTDHRTDPGHRRGSGDRASGVRPCGADRLVGAGPGAVGAAL